jgi:hypothetical protein
MKHLVLKFTLAMSLFVNACFSSHNISDFMQYENLQEHTEQARQSFEEIYYQLLEKGFFPLTYNNNLIIDTNLRSNVKNGCMVLLRLIEWLEKRDDSDSFFLLKRLNKLMFLELTHYLSGLELEKEVCAGLIDGCQDLYSFKASPDGYVVKPFRATLSKLFLVMNMINASDVNYKNRKETFALALGKVKKEMIDINKKLGTAKIDEDIIKSFISALEIHAVKEPLVQAHTIRNTVIIITVLTVAGLLIYFYAIPKVRQWLAENQPPWLTMDYWVSKINELYQRAIDPIAKGIAQHLARELQEHSEAIGTGLGKGIGNGLFNAAPGQKPPTEPMNPVVDRFLNTLVTGIQGTIDTVPARTGEAVKVAVRELEPTLNSIPQRAGDATRAALQEVRPVLNEIPRVAGTAAANAVSEAVRQMPGGRFIVGSGVQQQAAPVQDAQQSRGFLATLTSHLPFVGNRPQPTQDDQQTGVQPQVASQQ